MNAVSELINNLRNLVRDVACLTDEGRLFQIYSGFETLLTLMTPFTVWYAGTQINVSLVSKRPSAHLREAYWSRDKKEIKGGSLMALLRKQSQMNFEKKNETDQCLPILSETRAKTWKSLPELLKLEPFPSWQFATRHTY